MWKHFVNAFSSVTLAVCLTLPCFPFADGHSSVWMTPREEALQVPIPISTTYGSGHGLQNSDLGGLGPTLDALTTMQSGFFELWAGTWPAAIDWTAAVLGTFISGALLSVTSLAPSQDENGIDVENTVNEYFSQSITFYFGQNAFSLRTQAFDDMLWVVLGWLEGLKFINTHAYYYLESESDKRKRWHGLQFQQPFAHRARIFYELAEKGWDTKLCGGGMVWNPYLQPYKNAITNELFIAASVNMYLYFPGDNNTSPFATGKGSSGRQQDIHDQKYLQAAVQAYDWLVSSNMTNRKGLYVDGYHISRTKGTNNTNCDERNEMVYTYNQGVILSGLRGLWEITGRKQYLDDAYMIIRSVIKATGWSLENDLGKDSDQWQGLGRRGILEDTCDSGGHCSQDGQMFKGIFFHHLTFFCTTLPRASAERQIETSFDKVVVDEHLKTCRSIAAWVMHNARAASATRDSKGRYGMWWGDHPKGHALDATHEGVDHINPKPTKDEIGANHEGVNGDANDRGRGRTVETQAGGLAVVRAALEFARL